MNLTLTTPELIVIAVIAILIVAGALWLYARDRSRTADLRRRYGPEYDLALKRYGSRRKAEAELLQREKSVQQLPIHDLDPAEREHFSERWKLVQSHFVDSPQGALAEADELVSSVMKSRGYPVSNLDECAAGIMVNHPAVAEDYRATRAISSRPGKGAASTEELRTALLHYRALFNDVIGARSLEERKAA